MKYETLIFDCDGVILDSNNIKSDGFYNSVIHFGDDNAKSFVEYHKANGGISRYEKFRYFFSGILKKDLNELAYKDLLDKFSSFVAAKMICADVTDDLYSMKERYSDVCWMLVSGGDQEEIRKIFSVRGLDKYFEGGIFGSPQKKGDILKNKIKNKSIKLPAVYFGDSRVDFFAAKAAGVDFIFVSKWTEVDLHEEFCRENCIRAIKTISDFT